jgi:hypothetical protein
MPEITISGPRRQVGLGAIRPYIPAGKGKIRPVALKNDQALIKNDIQA